MTREKDDPRKDQNWLAYQRSMDAHEFDNLKSGTYVAYSNGQLIAIGTKDEVLKSLDNKSTQGYFVHEVGDDAPIDMSQSFWFNRPDLN